MAKRLQVLFQEYCEDLDLMFADMDRDIHIEEGLVPHEQRTQPETFLHWGRLAALAEHAVAKQKAHIDDEVWPAAMAKARETPKESGGKIYKYEVSELAQTDPLYVRAHATKIELEAIHRHLTVMVNALYQRKDMLQSVGAFQRVELESYPADLDKNKERYRTKMAQKREAN